MPANILEAELIKWMGLLKVDVGASNIKTPQYSLLKELTIIANITALEKFESKKLPEYLDLFLKDKQLYSDLKFSNHVFSIVLNCLTKVSDDGAS